MARRFFPAAVARTGEDEARAVFRALRWHAKGGEPVCPACGCLATHELRTRRLFEREGCGKQLGLTSVTISTSASAASATTCSPSRPS